MFNHLFLSHMKKQLFLLFILISFLGLSQDFIPDEILVQINPQNNADYTLNKLADQGGFKIVAVQNISQPLNVYQLKIESSNSLDEIIKIGYQFESIIHLQKNHIIKDRSFIPNDTIFGNQWHLNNTGQSGGIIDADIDAVEAWDITQGGLTTHNDTIVVCIIETNGVDINHVDLVDNIWKNYAEIPGNGIDDDGNGYIDDFNGWNIQTNTDVISSGGHGSKVAGMVGAIGNNTTGVSGVNHHVKMMIIQGQNANSEASVVEAYSYPLEMRKRYNLTNGNEGAFVVVTNASWGVDTGSATNSPLWCALYDSLGTYGILNIGATTNNNANVDVVGDLPTTCPSDYLIGVTMSNSADQRLGGYGVINVDLAAPGAGVWVTNSSNHYTSDSGTSFAAPCVTGAVALLYSSPCSEFISLAKEHPDSAALKMRALLLNNVDAIGAMVGEVATGGRLNVNNALLDLINNCDTNACIKPFNLSSSNISDTSITISWEGIDNDQYNVYLTDGVNSSFLNTNQNQNIVFNNLQPCTNYTVEIESMCGTDTTDLSFPMTIKTDGCCNNPELNLDSISMNSIHLIWDSILYASQYIIQFRSIDSIDWNLDTITTNGYEILNLDTCQEYEIAIKTICTDSSQGFSPIVIIKTLGCGACYEGNYCPLDATDMNTNWEWIESVTLNGFTSQTGNNNGYYEGGLFTNGLLSGDSYQIGFIPGYQSFLITENYSVWIDIDQNGQFESSEQLISNLSGQGPMTALLIIPTTNIEGITKMRIAMNGQISPTLCADEPLTIFAEYEDYCIYIGSEAGVENIEQNILLYPNPTNGLLNIESDYNIELIKIYNAIGQLIILSENPQNTIDLSSFENGIYFIEIKTESGTKTQKIIKQ